MNNDSRVTENLLKDGSTLVFVYGTAGSPAETYCLTHANCVFVEEEEETTK